MNANDLELKIAGLEKAIQEHKADTSRYEDELKQTSKQLKDYNKIALPPAVFDDIYEAIERGVEEYDFSDTGNFDIEYGIEYDGRVHCESHEMSDSGDLVRMIVERVSRIFTEADCPEELDTTEDDNHPVEKLQN
tara:strand:- start:6 stop:410 length:405 start_codon:yes stop_codon:yes gene_type:complete